MGITVECGSAGCGPSSKLGIVCTGLPLALPFLNMLVAVELARSRVGGELAESVPFGVVKDEKVSGMDRSGSHSYVREGRGSYIEPASAAEG